MKPVVLVFLLVCGCAYFAYASVRDFAADVSTAQQEVDKAAKDLNDAKDSLAKTENTVREAQARAPHVSAFLKAWSATFPAYSRVREVVDPEVKRLHVQIVDNSEVQQNAMVKIRGVEYQATKRLLEFSGKLPDVVEFLGVYEKDFELFQTDQVTMARKGDKTDVTCVQYKPDLVGGE